LTLKTAFDRRFLVWRIDAWDYRTPRLEDGDTHARPSLIDLKNAEYKLVFYK